MMIRRDFYNSVRRSLFGGSLTQGQVDGMEALIDEYERRQIDTRWFAYILGTAYHEVARTMQPIEEFGRGRGRPYVPFYGRGFVQLTWEANYKKMGLKLSPVVDLVAHRERALELGIATQVIFTGMIDGDFSRDSSGRRHNLARYFNDSGSDWYNARRIVNLLDRASDISGYARKFYRAILLSDRALRDDLRIADVISINESPQDTNIIDNMNPLIQDVSDFSIGEEATFILRDESTTSAL